ncbi:MAG: CDP-diacylglycerol--serine O-phosphatidyltransferase [Candidatus Rokubacteria bacterium]|nr:CDP-diacylglycerol--serine O-phosphatidyltransferase [Candidatus Rokubacteria bacterium]
MPRGQGRLRSALREKRRRGIFLLPSLLTTGNLFCGFLAIILATEGDYHWAALTILIAMVLDILDGKVARLTKTTTQFGLEFDSLADVVSFCVAPALLLYFWALAPLGRVGWLAAFLYVICGAMRLARFNVMSGSGDRRYFLGLPTPAAAGVLVAIVLLFEKIELARAELFVLSMVVYLLAFLMISSFRYHSFKELDFGRRRPLGVLLLVVLAVLIVASHPQLFLFLLFGIYALSGPARRLILRKREPSAAQEEAASGELKG